MFSHTPLLTPTNEQMACKADIEKHLKVLNKHYVSYAPIVKGTAATVGFTAWTLLLIIASIHDSKASYNAARPQIDELTAEWRDQPIQAYTERGLTNTTCGAYWGNIANMTDNCHITISPEQESELLNIYQCMKACFRLAYEICDIASDTNYVAKNSFMIALGTLSTAASLAYTIKFALNRWQNNNLIDKTSLANVLSTEEMQEFKDLISKAKLNLSENSTLGTAITTLKQIKRSIDNYNCDALTPMRPGLNN